ncbi:DoxX family protein [Sphingosinicella terrae]|jgi:hypothetical protein|uniref:DoxX family protein n=1 Tax=Sphingosinicella terrae TaxID=2172047 RepID=UPI000E0D806E|nr:DoxX family protein [Sphingosinicella terrae]
MTLALQTPAPDAALPRSRNTAFRAGWAMSGLVIAFLAMDGAMKLSQLPIVSETSGQLGWPNDPATINLLGILLLGSTLLYAVPRTAMLGAILLTGYLGGAVATHVRIASPLFSHVLFGVYIGLLAWGGLWLRDPRVRALLPLRR